MNVAHDYFADSRYAITFLRDSVQADNQFGFTNPTTGTASTQSEMATRLINYTNAQLAETTLISFVAIFEAFMADFVRSWLRAYPLGMGDRSVKITAVVAAGSYDGAIDAAIDEELQSVFYKRPDQWFEYIEKRVKLGVPSADQVERLTEVKAGRDLLVHNGGVVNALYLQKAGRFARGILGERLVYGGSFHDASWQLLRGIVDDVAGAAIARAN